MQALLERQKSDNTIVDDSARHVPENAVPGVSERGPGDDPAGQE
jgi:hypothetical protein